MSVSGQLRRNAYWITLNRPEKLNSINFQMWRGLGDEFSKAVQETEARAIVLTGSGKFFCGGEDIADLDSIRDAKEALELFLDHVRPFFDMIFTSPKPVICALNGPAHGIGVELVMASDLAVSVKDSYLSLSQGWIGVGPSIASTIGLPLLGKKRLFEMIMTGRKIQAEEALDWGLLNKVVEKDLGGAVDELVDQISKTPPVLTRLIKGAFMRQLSLSDYSSVFREIALYSTSKETKTGVSNFMHKSKD